MSQNRVSEVRIPDGTHHDAAVMLGLVTESGYAGDEWSASVRVT